jgi:hypothetical protein
VLPPGSPGAAVGWAFRQEAFQIVALALQLLAGASASSTRARGGAVTLSTSSTAILRFRRSSENPPCRSIPRSSAAMSLSSLYNAKTGPRGGGHAQVVHQRLRAMVPGADRDTFLVQYGAEIVRMHPIERETDDAGRILRPEQRDVVDGAQRARAAGATSAASCAWIASSPMAST